jgi:hypothetical protein
MTQDEIIEMAVEAGFDWSGKELTWEGVICTEEIEALIKLAIAKEREACAKVCEQIDTAAFGGERPTPNDCAAAIRARGEA